MANQDAQNSGKLSIDEICGRCSATVESGLDMCPSCGALLSAYRTPVVTADEVPLSITDEVSEIRSAPAVRTEPLPRPAVQSTTDHQAIPETDSVSDDDSLIQLTEARQELLTTLIAPERRLLDAIESEILEFPDPAPAPLPAPQSVKPTARTALPVRTSVPPYPVENSQKVSRPKKPGFVAIGSIEPVVLIGSLIFVIAVLAGLISSAGAYRPGAVVALVLGTLGIFMIIFAMLVALVRKDQRRR